MNKCLASLARRGAVDRLQSQLLTRWVRATLPGLIASSAPPARPGTSPVAPLAGRGCSCRGTSSRLPARRQACDRTPPSGGPLIDCVRFVNGSPALGRNRHRRRMNSSLSGADVPHVFGAAPARRLRHTLAAHRFTPASAAGGEGVHVARRFARPVRHTPSAYSVQPARYSRRTKASASLQLVARRAAASHSSFCWPAR